jgi:hypothetical protein
MLTIKVSDLKKILGLLSEHGVKWKDGDDLDVNLLGNPKTLFLREHTLTYSSCPGEGIEDTDPNLESILKVYLL